MMLGIPMSQTTQILVVPLSEGHHTVRISSSVTGVYDARIEDGYIVFAAGPDFIGALHVNKEVVVKLASEGRPASSGPYQSAGDVDIFGRQMTVWVQMPR